MKQNRLKIIGLTGGSGSGKSTVAAMLAKLGAFVMDADRMVRDISVPGEKAYQEIVAFFGSEIMNQDKTLDRKKLGAVVFSDKDKLKKLEEITHKYVKERMENLLFALDKDPGSYTCIAIDAPLLIEGGLTSWVDEVWVTVSSEETRIKRIVARDRISEADAKKRFQNQKKEQEFREHAHVIFENNGSEDDLRALVFEHWSRLIDDRKG